MRKRSYDYYEVVRFLDGSAHSVLFRGTYETCDKYLRNIVHLVDEQRVNLYLIHCQLIEAYKSDKT